MSNEIKEEIQAIAAPVAGIGNANCYRVPDNYFEDLADEIMSKIHLPATQSPFTAPVPAYFEGLADSILHKIKSNGIIVEEDDNEVNRELQELSPLLSGIPKTDVYTVPAGYFANFKVAIPAAKQAKVVSMNQPVRWIRYAAAAAIVGVIAVGSTVWLKDDGDKITGTNGLHSIAKVDLSSVSDDAIANYISNSPLDMDVVLPVYDESKVNAGSLTEKLLQDVSDAEIQEYLKENQQTSGNDIKGI